MRGRASSSFKVENLNAGVLGLVDGLEEREVNSGVVGLGMRC